MFLFCAYALPNVCYRPNMQNRVFFTTFRFNIIHLSYVHCDICGIHTEQYCNDIWFVSIGISGIEVAHETSGKLPCTKCRAIKHWCQKCGAISRVVLTARFSVHDSFRLVLWAEVALKRIFEWLNSLSTNTLHLSISWIVAAIEFSHVKLPMRSQCFIQWFLI